MSPFAPTAAVPLVEVEHRCGHRVRWSFWKDEKMLAIVAADFRCMRCDEEYSGVIGPTDFVFPNVGVAHMHVGRCPDSPHTRWLDAMLVRIK